MERKVNGTDFAAVEEGGWPEAPLDEIASGPHRAVGEAKPLAKDFKAPAGPLHVRVPAQRQHDWTGPELYETNSGKPYYAWSCRNEGCNQTFHAPDPTMKPFATLCPLNAPPEAAVRDLLQRLEPDGYDELRRVLRAAVEQASAGKGKARHAGEGEAFEDQQIVQDGVWMKNTGFQVGQARKKLMESTRLPPDRAKAEILGAIVYAAAAFLVIEKISK